MNNYYESTHRNRPRLNPIMTYKFKRCRFECSEKSLIRAERRLHEIAGLSCARSYCADNLPLKVYELTFWIKYVAGNIITLIHKIVVKKKGPSGRKVEVQHDHISLAPGTRRASDNLLMDYLRLIKPRLMQLQHQTLQALAEECTAHDPHERACC